MVNLEIWNQIFASLTSETSSVFQIETTQLTLYFKLKSYLHIRITSIIVLNILLEITSKFHQKLNQMYELYYLSCKFQKIWGILIVSGWIEASQFEKNCLTF